MKNLVEYITNESLLDDEEDLLNDDVAIWQSWLDENIKIALNRMQLNNDFKFKIVKNGKKYLITGNGIETYWPDLHINLPNGAWPKELEISDKIYEICIYSECDNMKLNDLDLPKPISIRIVNPVMKTVNWTKNEKIDTLRIDGEQLESFNLNISSVTDLHLEYCKNIKLTKKLKFPKKVNYIQLNENVLNDFLKEILNNPNIPPETIHFINR
jgi:hypothetical protein